MIDLQPLWDWFRVLHETSGIKLTIFYDNFDRARFFNGFLTSVRLMAVCLVASVVIGVVGAWIQGSRLRVLRLVTQGYIQFFRNTPPLVQLYFFYFALGSYLKVTTGTGMSVPLVSNFTWAAICLSFYAGAFNVEIFRAGIEAVPRETLEAAESLGYSRLKAYAYVILPLAFRISLPALNNNLVNLIKTTTIAYAIAVPGNALRREPDLVGRVERARDDERAAHRLRVAGRRAGVGDGPLGAGADHSGILAGMIANRSDLAVLKPFRIGAREPWRFTIWHGVALLIALFIAVGIGEAQAQASGKPGIVETILKWTPLLAQGFALNIAMSFLAMAIGTAVGVPLGLAQISLLPPVRFSSWFATQFFRNSPWLVLLFYCMLLLPFEVRIGGTIIPLPGWFKSTIGLSLPVMANVSELVRGAVRSIPYGQWEAAEFARDVAAADAVHGHPAAMREAHDAAVDEPLRDPHRRDAAHLRGRRQRGDDA